MPVKRIDAFRIRNIIMSTGLKSSRKVRNILRNLCTQRIYEFFGWTSPEQIINSCVWKVLQSPMPEGLLISVAYSDKGRRPIASPRASQRAERLCGSFQRSGTGMRGSGTASRKSKHLRWVQIRGAGRMSLRLAEWGGVVRRMEAALVGEVNAFISVGRYRDIWASWRRWQCQQEEDFLQVRGSRAFLYLGRGCRNRNSLYYPCTDSLKIKKRFSAFALTSRIYWWS
jgi:hypothetical protein